ncbi:hypothetical protein KY284_032258 [Solanum tuberosum]|nr:hypothetical protein KY284_032258 [Solanum tuberosum]
MEFNVAADFSMSDTKERRGGQSEKRGGDGRRCLWSLSEVSFAGACCWPTSLTGAVVGCCCLSELLAAGGCPRRLELLLAGSEPLRRSSPLAGRCSERLGLLSGYFPLPAGCCCFCWKKKKRGEGEREDVGAAGGERRERRIGEGERAGRLPQAGGDEFHRKKNGEES